MVGNVAKILMLLAAAMLAHADAVIEGSVAFPSAEADIGKYVRPRLAVVYLEGTFPHATNYAPVVQVVQKNSRLEPAILPIRAGARVEFRNADVVPHELFSYSAAKRFELGLSKPNEPICRSQVFENPGAVILRCALDDEMRGLILVLPTPYFTVTDEAGHFRLAGLPAGRFTAKAWINGRIMQKDVDVPEEGTTKIWFR